MNSRTANLFIAGAAALGFALTLYAWYPGYMTFDAAYQYWQVRHFEFTTHHPPLMALTWWVTDRLVPGPGGLLAWHLFLYWAGLWLIAARLPVSGWWRVAGLLVIGFWPYNLLVVSHVWKDVAMAAALLGAFGCLLWYRETGRKAWLWGTIVLAVYGACMRHNALPAVLPLFAWLSWTACRKGTHPVSRTVAWTAGLLALTVAVSAMLNALPMVEKKRLWPTLALWDLAHISAGAGEVLMPAFTVGPGMTPEELSEAIEPWTNTTLFSDTRSGVNNGLLTPYSEEQAAALFRAWAGAVRDHPDHYLSHRWALTRALYGLEDFPGQEQTGPNFTIVAFRDNPEFRISRTPLNRWLRQWLWPDDGRWYYDGWVYVLLSALLLAGSFLLRSGRVGEVRLFSVSGLLYSAALPLVAPAADLRFHSWLVPATLIAVAFALAAIAETRCNKTVTKP